MHRLRTMFSVSRVRRHCLITFCPLRGYPYPVTVRCLRIDLLQELQRFAFVRLAQLLVLGIMATRMTGHTLLRHGILIRLLLLL